MNWSVTSRYFLCWHLLGISSVSQQSCCWYGSLHMPLSVLPTHSALSFTYTKCCGPFGLGLKYFFSEVSWNTFFRTRGQVVHGARNEDMENENCRNDESFWGNGRTWWMKNHQHRNSQYLILQDVSMRNRLFSPILFRIVVLLLWF